MMYTFNFENMARAVCLDMQLETAIQRGQKWLECWKEAYRQYAPSGLAGIVSLEDPEGYRIFDRVLNHELGGDDRAALPYIQNEIRLWTEFLYGTLGKLNKLAEANVELTGGYIFTPQGTLCKGEGALSDGILRGIPAPQRDMPISCGANSEKKITSGQSGT